MLIKNYIVFKMMQLQDIARSLDDGKLLRSLGARRGQDNVSAGVQRRIALWRRRLPELITPRLVHRIIDLHATSGDRAVLSEDACFNSPKLARTLRGADKVCCFVATIGAGLETEVKRCMEHNRFADAYVLDTLGSMVVEALVDRFHIDHEKTRKSKGQAVTLRFSPGYCDWPLMEQIDLFARFGKTRPAGVQLTETCLMSPQKSISGVFGILPRGVDGSVADYNPCRSCRQPRCIARRAPAVR